MFGVGTLKYFDDEWKVNVLLDDDLANFYRSLIPKHIQVNRPKYQPHITVVRNEEVPNKNVWKKYEGLEVRFKYGCVTSGKVYWWLPVYCRKLTLIRRELGLPSSTRLTRPPSNRECFHLTVANMKGT